MRIIADHAIFYNQYSRVLRRFTQCFQCIRPCRVRTSPVLRQLERGSNPIGKRCNFSRTLYRGNKGQWFLPLIDQEIPHPLLTALHGLKSFQQVGTGTFDCSIAKRATIRDRQLLLGWGRQKQVPQGRKSPKGKFFELPECWLLFPFLPLLQFRKLFDQFVNRQARPVNGPANKLRVDGNGGHDLNRYPPWHPGHFTIDRITSLSYQG